MKLLTMLVELLCNARIRHLVPVVPAPVRRSGERCTASFPPAGAIGQVQILARVRERGRTMFLGLVYSTVYFRDPVSKGAGQVPKT